MQFDGTSSLDAMGYHDSSSSKATRFHPSIESRPENETWEMDSEKRKSLASTHVCVGEMPLTKSTSIDSNAIVSGWLANQHMQEKRKQYHRRQLMVATVTENHNWEIGMGLVIAVNVVFIVMEANLGAECRRRGDDKCEMPAWLDVANYTLLGIYFVELVLKLYAYRFDFIRSRWNILDFCIVTVGFADVMAARIPAAMHLPNMPIFRLLRIARLLRAFRLLFAVREFYLLLHGFLSSLHSVFWGCMLMLGMTMIWAIISVELLDSINRSVDHGSNTFCDKAFSSVWYATLLFFQTLVAGDSWGACTIPLIEHSPWTFIIFFGALGTILMGFGNLILAVIVARAEESREADHIQKSKEKDVETAKEKKRLLEICRSLDRDRDGQVTLIEMLHAYDHDIDLQTVIKLMDIERDDLSCVYQLLDERGSGKVAIDDFVNSLLKIKTQDSRTMLHFLKYHILCNDKRVEDVERSIMAKLESHGAMLSSIEAKLSQTSCCKSFIGSENCLAVALPSPMGSARRLDSPPISADVKRYAEHHQSESLIALGQQIEAMASQLRSQLLVAPNLAFDITPSDGIKAGNLFNLTPKHVPQTPIQKELQTPIQKELQSPQAHFSMVLNDLIVGHTPSMISACRLANRVDSCSSSGWDTPAEEHVEANGSPRRDRFTTVRVGENPNSSQRPSTGRK